jgi:hypothetical protein
MLNAGSGSAMTLRNKAHSPGCSGYRLHPGMPVPFVCLLKRPLRQRRHQLVREPQTDGPARL